jgi:hypothetical protein
MSEWPRSGRGPEIRDMVLPPYHGGTSPPPPPPTPTNARAGIATSTTNHMLLLARGGAAEKRKLRKKKEKEETRRIDTFVPAPAARKTKYVRARRTACVPPPPVDSLPRFWALLCFSRLSQARARGVQKRHNKNWRRCHMSKPFYKNKKQKR